MSVAPDGYGQNAGQQPPWTAPPPASMPAGGPGGGVATAGRIGTPTSAGKQILLSIVTLGIWEYVWTYRQHKEIQEWGGQGLGGGIGFLLCFVSGGLVTYFLLPNEIEKYLYQRTGQPSPVTVNVGFWALIPIAGPIIWYPKVQRALNEFWVSQGAQPA